MTTAVIQIGNSDNKLTQAKWAGFVARVRCELESYANEIHFEGGSDWDASWQNGCWVIEIDDERLDQLKDQLRDAKKTYKQDSVAVTTGVTEMV